jgi:hypothetical protein
MLKCAANSKAMRFWNKWRQHAYRVPTVIDLTLASTSALAQRTSEDAVAEALDAFGSTDTYRGGLVARWQPSDSIPITRVARRNNEELDRPVALAHFEMN